MPTYRYWEEAQISDADMIKETSYYRLMMSIIEEFEQQGLIKDLRLAGHPKFSASLIQAMPEYEYLIENNIGKALQEARIFITDYSSASYDAHYRGAYIIYYWAERDYLIENYQAVPPINEENCDGVPVFSMAELAQQVKVAISKDYQMDELYKERYKKINEFSDNRNCDRLIDYLEEEGIV
jgi:CDP-glycerol glycerophosphotransferase (TagB/SpsB family)